MAQLKVGVLISGRGSNLEALIAACAGPDQPFAIAMVISNVPEAPGLMTARRHGIATTVVDHRQYPDRAAFDASLDGVLRAAGIGLVCLAGFMRLLTDGMVESWRDRLINIHPSLLPAFKGRHPQRQALEAGVRLSGCTVHFVRPAMDAGPIIAQAAAPVLPGDDEATLSARILRAEHRLYPTVVRLIAEGQVAVKGEQVVLSPQADGLLRQLSGLHG